MDTFESLSLLVVGESLHCRSHFPFHRKRPLLHEARLNRPIAFCAYLHGYIEYQSFWRLGRVDAPFARHA